MNISEQIEQILNESPKVVSQDEMNAFEDKDFRKKMVKRLIKHKAKWKFETTSRNNSGVPRDIYSVKLGSGTEYFSLLYDDTELGYYVKMVNVNNTTSKLTPKSQALVWQDATVRVAEDMFLSYYLPKYKVLATDQYHTPRGRRFWTGLVGAAVHKGYSVYFVYKGEAEKTVKIKSERDLHDLSDTVWGMELKYKHRLILISKTTIPEFETNINY